MRFNYILASIVFYISLSAAWPWPANIFLRDSSGQLARRQDDNKPASSSAAPASKADSNTASQTGSATDKPSSDSKPTDKPSDNNNNDNNNKNQTSKSTSVSITQAEAGGVSMINPPATSTTYYKIGENITWVWNYTSLAVTPNAVNVVVSCASLGATYTVATNMSVAATATVIWDTEKEATAQPAPGTNKYTLAIYDAGEAAGPTQINSPGKLGSWSQFTFGMYTKQPYVDGSGYQCVTCNSAVAIAERQAFGVIFTVAAITIVSFTWFTSGFLSF